MNRFVELMKVAWDDCRNSIGIMGYYILGTATFAFLLLVFFMKAYAPVAATGRVTSYAPPGFAGTVYGVMIALAPTVFPQTVFFCLSAVIIVSFLIYAVAFIHICYIYDNRSWDLINVPVQFFIASKNFLGNCSRYAMDKLMAAVGWMNERDRKQHLRYMTSNYRYCKEREDRIAAIRTGKVNEPEDQ